MYVFVQQYTNYVCFVIVAIAMVLAGLIIGFCYQRTENKAVEMEYETKLFNANKVHSVDIVINENDWNSMQENAADKEYVICDVIIDGEDFQNVGIRTKGNSSLSEVSLTDSSRYSFKVEFDHYKDGNSCWELDKLSLNNIIQDSTYMKDYLSYTLMNEMGVNAPLCSYICVKVNGEDFGLYLAVEGVEESFAKRNYGTDYGNLYKPETAEMANMMDADQGDMEGMPDMSDMFEDGEVPHMSQIFGEGGFGPGDGSTDVALQYLDGKISSYRNIFDGAVFDVTDVDKTRLISSIKQMNKGEKLEEVLDVDKVLRYFVVHNFVTNFDSYTGMLMHNYYLYEKEGKLSMVPWDYNLSFGGFTMGFMKNDESESSLDSDTEYVNYPIDTPVSGISMEERPLLNSLLTNDKYLQEYHDYFEEFISSYLESGYSDKRIDSISKMIAPYVEKDKTAFYTYDEFEKGVTTLKEFCNLRAESIRGQLNETIPSTSEGQEDSQSLIDAGHISIEDMGSVGIMEAMKNTNYSDNIDDNDSNAEGEKSDLSEGVPVVSSKMPTMNSEILSIQDIKKILIIVVSCLVLLGGILWTKKYRRR